MSKWEAATVTMVDLPDLVGQWSCIPAYMVLELGAVASAARNFSISWIIRRGASDSVYAFRGMA